MVSPQSMARLDCQSSLSDPARAADRRRSRPTLPSCSSSPTARALWYRWRSALCWRVPFRRRRRAWGTRRSGRRCRLGDRLLNLRDRHLLAALGARGPRRAPAPAWMARPAGRARRPAGPNPTSCRIWFPLSSWTSSTNVARVALAPAELVIDASCRSCGDRPSLALASGAGRSR